MLNFGLPIPVDAEALPRKRKEQTALQLVSGEMTVFLVVMLYDFVFHFILLSAFDEKPDA